MISCLYDSDYFSSRPTVGYDDYFSASARHANLTTSKRRLCVLEENGISSFGKTLEVGCATGEFCHVVHDRGEDVTGIDLSQAAIEIARSRYETIPFQSGTIDDVDSEVKYRALIAFELVEHLTDPDRFFSKASTLLEHNGILCLTTPSFECAESVGFDNWIGFSSSFEHLYFFSSTTIGEYAAKYGMQSVCTLYGGGEGRRRHRNFRFSAREMAKRTLYSMRVLEAARGIKRMMQSDRPIQHDYQSENIRHNLFIVLRKK